MFTCCFTSVHIVGPRGQGVTPPMRWDQRRCRRLTSLCRVAVGLAFTVRVGCLLDLDLCCSCVGRSSPASRRACTPTRRCHTGTRACPRPEDRLPSAAAGLQAIPFYPSARPGMTHRDEQSMRRRAKSSLPTMTRSVCATDDRQAHLVTCRSAARRLPETSNRPVSITGLGLGQPSSGRGGPCGLLHLEVDRNKAVSFLTAAAAASMFYLAGLAAFLVMLHSRRDARGCGVRPAHRG